MIQLTKDLIEAALKYLTDRIVLAVFLASSICLLLILVPGWFGIWMKTYWTWLFVVWLLSACYLPTGFLLNKIGALSADRKRQQRLHHLTPDEKAILAPYIKFDVRTRKVIFSDPVAKGLADDGVLYIPEVVRDQYGNVSYNIRTWAQAYLRKNPDLLNSAPASPNTESK